MGFKADQLAQPRKKSSIDWAYEWRCLPFEFAVQGVAWGQGCLHLGLTRVCYYWSSLIWVEPVREWVSFICETYLGGVGKATCIEIQAACPSLRTEIAVISCKLILHFKESVLLDCLSAGFICFFCIEKLVLNVEGHNPLQQISPWQLTFTPRHQSIWLSLNRFRLQQPILLIID